MSEDALGQSLVGRPLDGVRVLDLSIALVPVASLLLADLGAEVIKVEQPRGQGFNRAANVAADGGRTESSVAVSVERSKKSVTVDWHTERGRDLVLDLVESADVVIENFGPGHMERWGLGYAAMKARNPQLVYCGVTAFGNEGPLSHKKAIDLVFQGFAGHMAITGTLDGEVVKCAPPVGDFPGVYLAVSGILAALLDRTRTGEGQKVEVALFDAALFALMPREQEFWMAGRSTGPLGTRHPSVVPHQAFKTSDGRLLNIAVPREDEWHRVCEVLGESALATDDRFDTIVKRYENREILIELLQDRFLTRTCDEWQEALDAVDIMCGPVLSVGEALSQEQTLVNEMVVDVDHATLGTIKVIGSPIKLPQGPGPAISAPPVLGQHTDEVLTELLGMSASEISALRDSDVI